jgi:hypothetical protein
MVAGRVWFEGIAFPAKIIASFIGFFLLVVVVLVGLKTKTFLGHVLTWALLLLIYAAPLAMLKQGLFAEYLFPLQSDVFVQSSEVITIPAGGGMSIKFGKEETYYKLSTLMAGYDYYAPFTLTNDYVRGVDFTYAPFVEVLYEGTKVKFEKWEKSVKLEESSKKDFLEIFKPEELTVVGKPCPYSDEVLLELYEEVECSADTKCGEGVCLEVGMMVCRCVDWEKATCNGDAARVGISYVHDGFLRGVATLYYSKEEYVEVPTQKYVQGPLTVYAIFHPNPWIEKIYGEGGGVVLMLEGYATGDITINEVKIDSTFTQITTSVYGYSKEVGDIVNFTITENLTLEKVECRHLVEEKLPLKKRVVFYECNFNPPSLTLVSKEIKKLDIKEEERIAYEELEEYCKEGFRNRLFDIFPESVASELDKILEGRSSFCKIIEGEEIETKELLESEVEEMVKNMLRSIHVNFEIVYTHSGTELSSWVDVYKDTPACPLG